MKVDSYSVNQSGILVPLIQLGSPNLYSTNLFWVLNVSHTTSEREIKKKIRLLRSEKLNGYSNFNKLDDFENDGLQHLETRMRNPETRFMDEFFTYWSEEFTGFTHCQFNDAQSVKIALTEVFKVLEQYEQKRIKDYLLLHDLAVYIHYHALQFEQTKYQPKKINQILQRIWTQSLELWNQCLEEEAVWSHIRQRIREYSDPRITTGFVRRLQKTLLPTVYSIHFHFFCRYRKSQNHEKSIIHKQLLSEQNANPNDLEISFSISGEAFVNQINHSLNQLSLQNSKNANWQTSLEEFQSQISEPMRIVQDWLPENTPLRNELSNSGASAILKYTVKNCLENQEFQAAIRWLQYAHDLASSTTLKQRIEENIKNAKINQECEICWFCETFLSDKRSDIIVTKNPSILPVFLLKNETADTVSVPRCSICKEIHTQHIQHCLGGSLIGMASGLATVFMSTYSSIALAVFAAVAGFSMGYGIVHTFAQNRILQQRTKPFSDFKESPAYKKRVKNINFHHSSPNEIPRNV